VPNPSLPVSTLPEFIAYAKANPGKIAMASFGIGSISHVAGELFKMMAGVDLLHVPYRGDAPALTDLLAGQVQVYFGGVPPSVGYIRTGRLRALAVTTAARSDTLPEVPTVREFVPSYEVGTWFGIGAPRTTSADIVARLNEQINTGLADPKIKARFAELSGMLLPGSPDDFRKLIAEEVDKWGKVIRAANIRAE
jgi:tripartite-type tricarboxylate transporter receptor subunit TctC